MTNDLPRGWTACTLGDLFDFKYGKGLPQEKRSGKGSVSVYGSNGIVGVHNAAITRGPTIVVGRKGSVGEVHLSPEACWPIDTTYFIDEFPANLPPSYWAVYLKSLRLGQQEKSSAIPGISRDDIYGVKVPLPSLNEQGRIVAKLEKLLGKVDACQQRLARIPILLKRFRQSVLAAACFGRLTADWREENPNVENASTLVAELERIHEAAGGHKKGNAAPPSDEAHDLSVDDLPSSWRLTEMRSVVCPDRPITYGILKPGPDTPGGIPYVRVADFPPTQKRMQKAAKGVAVRGINIGDVRALQMPVPPLAEQQEIVRRVEALFTLADRIEARYAKGKAHVEKLTQSILAKAFRGELVPQDPNDEPATVLLERIRSQTWQQRKSNQKRKRPSVAAVG